MDNLKTKGRRGFTLVELLTVIAIITLMATLLVGASYRFVAGSRESATAATIMKANGIIQDRVRGFYEFDFSDASIIASNSWNLFNSNASSNNRTSWLDATSTNIFSSSADTISSNLAQVFIRKTRFKKAFPQSFAELDASQISRFFPANYPPGGSYNAKYESGIVLYAVLTKGETFGAPTPGEDTFSGSEIKNSAETGNLPCLVDGWGEPLRFYRWPTRLIRCGENDFDGSGAFDDYNQNTIQDPPAWTESTATYCSAIRPYSGFPGPTPASLLISNLPPFERASSYALGIDGFAGAAGVDDDGMHATDDPGEVGWPDTDDPESLNIDVDDPGFLLSSWLFDANIPPVNQPQRRAKFVSDFHDFYTYHTPLIVSAGADKQLGLYEPTDYSNTYGYLAAPQLATAPLPLLQPLFDNITNLNQRAGGR